VSTPLPVGPGTPYVTPPLLVQAPTGISWSSVPAGSGVTPAQRVAAQANLCQYATAAVDEIVNQPLRATINTEQYSGPDYRMTIQQSTGNIRMIMARWPILSILAAKVSPNVLPRSWRSLPDGYWDIEFPPIGLYGTSAPSAAGEGGQSIILAPYAGWCNGRNGFVANVQYINGWPHAGLIADAAAGDSEILVDDCTGWAITSEASGQVGAAGTVYDPAGQEIVKVTASSATSGPGTLTLSQGLGAPHTAGTMVSTLPGSVVWAAILLCADEALTRGATSTTVQTIPGGGTTSGTGGGAGLNSRDLKASAKMLLRPYARTI
jgi:hypothetical protein